MYFAIVACLLLLQPTAHASYDLLSINVIADADPTVFYGVTNLVSAYKLAQPNVDITINQTFTAGNSRNDVIEDLVDFAVFGSSSTTTVPTPGLFMPPFFLTGMVPVYRLDALGSTSAPLVLPGAVLARIILGNITWWNDSALVAANPSVTMPAQKINMVFASSSNPTNLILKTACLKFYPPFASGGMKLNNGVDFPFTSYASYQKVAYTARSLVSAVIGTDGSFAVADFASASSLGVNMALMVNPAGYTVSINSTSLTFAAVELGTKPLANVFSVADLTGATSTAAWPIAAFSYLLIDTVNARNTCTSRAAMVDFLLYVYQSPQAAPILASQGYVAVPSLVTEQLQVIETLTGAIQCRGQLVGADSSTTTTRTMGVSSSVSLLASLLISVYVDPDTTNIAWQAQPAAEGILIGQLANGEIDFALINPAYAVTDEWQALIDSGDFLMLPVFSQAIGFLVNPQLTSTVSIAAAVAQTPLVMDWDLITQLALACITNWNSASILAQNPWLTSLINNTSIPIKHVLDCAPSADVVSLTKVFQAQIEPFLSNGKASNATLQCLAAVTSSLTTAYALCTSTPTVQFISNTEIVPSLIMGSYAAVGLGQVDGDTTKVWARIPQLGNRVTTQPDINGIDACAYDTWDPMTLSFDFAASLNESCWPMTQIVMAVVRTQYYSSAAVTNGSSCTRGHDALQFADWMFSTTAIDALTDTILIGRPSQVPTVSAALKQALDGVLCDNTTLYITLATIWSLSTGLQIFGYVAACIGLVFTLALIGFIIVYHRNPIIRASSPIFLLISLVGIMLLFGAAMTLVSSVSASSCSILSWLINMGVMVTFAPLFAKTYRIYCIFGRRKLSVVKFSNKRLFLMVAALFVLEIIIMSVWQGISPLQPYTSTELSGTAITEYVQCGVGGQGSSMLAVAAVEKGVLLLFGALMAFTTRRVSSKFNESSQVALAIYNMIFSIGVMAPVILVIDAQGDVLAALLLFLLLWISCFTAGILVIPKALHIFNPSNDELQSVLGSSGNRSSGYSFLSLDHLDSLTTVKMYLAALKRHVEAVEVKQKLLQRSETPQQGPSLQPKTAHQESSPALAASSKKVVTEARKWTVHQRQTTQSNISTKEEAASDTDHRAAWGETPASSTRELFVPSAEGGSSPAPLSLPGSPPVLNRRSSTTPLQPAI